MKITGIAIKTAYIGAGAGMVLFALFGVLPCSLIGGAVGIDIAGWMFGLPLESGLAARAIILTSMLVGILVSGVAIVMVTASVGWIAGRVAEAALQEGAIKGEVKA